MQSAAAAESDGLRERLFLLQSRAARLAVIITIRRACVPSPGVKSPSYPIPPGIPEL